MENKIKSFEDYRLKNFIDIDDLKNKLEKYLELRLPISDELAILEQQKRDVSSAYSAWNTACKLKDEEIEALKIKFSEATKVYTDEIEELQKKISNQDFRICDFSAELLRSRRHIEELKMEIYDKEMIIEGLEIHRNLKNEKIEELQKEIEKMKCCGNCQRRYDGACYEYDNLCEKWSMIK